MSFNTVVTYSQIAIFNSNLETPFNDWNDGQVNQGFSWCDESISFKTLVSDESVRVEFQNVDNLSPRTDSVRTITVPFICNAGGEIEIATITDSYPISMQPGNYQIVFETGLNDDLNWCRISAIANGDAEPRVLLADTGLSPEYPLVMEAQSA